MKMYHVLTSVETLKGNVFVSDPVELNEKELDETIKTVNGRSTIRVTIKKGAQIKHKFIPMHSIHFIDVVAKEKEETK